MKDRIIKYSANIDEIAKGLVQIQRIKINVELLSTMAGETVEQVLGELVKKEKSPVNQNLFIANLAKRLKEDAEGDTLMKESTLFEGYDRALFNEKVLRKPVEEVMAELTGDNINKEELKLQYDAFTTEYKKIVAENLKPEMDLDSLRN